jgi:hypothetical protein
VERSSPDYIHDSLDSVASSLETLDPYSGCSHYILRACHSIANLVGRLERREIAERVELVEHVDAMYIPNRPLCPDSVVLTSLRSIGSLGSPVIQSDLTSLPKGVTVSQMSRLLFVAQRIRYAAFIFLHAALDRARTIWNLNDSVWVTVRRRIPYSKDEALHGALEMLADTPVGEHCEFAALTLPLFVAGCETSEAAKRYLILDRLHVMERRFGIGNISRAKDALMTIWQERSCGQSKSWWNILHEIGWELILS